MMPQLIEKSQKDRIKKALQKYFAAVMITAGVFIVGTLFYNQSKKVRDAEARYQTLLVESDRYRQEQLARFDSLETLRKDNIAKAQHKIDSLSTLYQKERSKYLDAQKKLNDKLAEVDSIPADSSYSYWNKTYPPISKQVYLLDSLQMKTAHKVDIAYKETNELIETFKASLIISDGLISEYQKSTNEYKELYNVNKQQKDLLAADNRKLVVEIEGLKGTVNKMKLVKNLAVAGIVTTGVIIIVKAIK